MMYKVLIGLVAVVAVVSALPNAQAQSVSLDEIRLVGESQFAQDFGRGESTVCKESAVSDVVKEGCYKTKNSRSFSGRHVPEIQLASR